jgi:light-regulated signal transduction histidine kinase (bacteriophytochrome)
MVASYTQLLARRYQGKLDEKADRYVAYAVDGATRMQTLIRDLLTYSRVGTRGQAPREVDSGKIVRDVLKDLRGALRDSGGKVEVADLPHLQADPTQLHQVFLNLVGNALKFQGEAPPRVAISARWVEDVWEFRVKDQGIGIDPDHAERIFQVFQRLHERDRYPGTGIGLALVKKIVERHGGRLGVESKLDEGATFWFTWPGLPVDERQG